MSGKPVHAIEFYNKTRNILSFTCNDGSSISVGGKERILIPMDQAGHESIVRAVGRGDLTRGRALWHVGGVECEEPKEEAPQKDAAPPAPPVKPEPARPATGSGRGRKTEEEPT